MVGLEHPVSSYLSFAVGQTMVGVLENGTVGNERKHQEISPSCTVSFSQGVNGFVSPGCCLPL